MRQELKIDGTLSTEKFFLINNLSRSNDDDEGIDKGGGYRYVNFFKLIGNTEGYGPHLFCSNQKKLQTGVKKFSEYGFEIEEVSRGKNAWKTFE